VTLIFNISDNSLVENPSFLFTPEEFQQAKSREELPVKCKCCGKILYRKKKDIQGSLKNQKTNFYCSSKCYYNLKRTLQEPKIYTCKTCGKIFTELPSMAASGDFCSKFCARKYTSSFGNTEEKKKRKSETLKKKYHQKEHKIPKDKSQKRKTSDRG
jgi:hypothetical protein